MGDARAGGSLLLLGLTQLALMDIFRGLEAVVGGRGGCLPCGAHGGEGSHPEFCSFAKIFVLNESSPAIHLVPVAGVCGNLPALRSGYYHPIKALFLYLFRFIAYLFPHYRRYLQHPWAGARPRGLRARVQPPAPCFFGVKRQLLWEHVNLLHPQT